MGIFDFLTGGGDIVKSIGDVIDSVTTTDEERKEQEIELVKTQFQYETEMRKLGVQEQEIYLQDKQSAREMAARVQESEKASWFAKNIAPILAFGTTILVFTLFAIIMFANIDTKRENIIIYVLGVLSAIVTQIFSYYFGSSQGSSDKNKLFTKFTGK